ncbi:MAG: hypothetical protein WAX89_01805 [Alphaproteobacteria bacterium]
MTDTSNPAPTMRGHMADLPLGGRRLIVTVATLLLLLGVTFKFGNVVELMAVWARNTTVIANESKTVCPDTAYTGSCWFVSTEDTEMVNHDLSGLAYLVFKHNAGHISQITNKAITNKQSVLLISSGVRWTFRSMYPNIIKAWETSPSSWTAFWLNTFFTLLKVGSLALVAFIMHRGYLWANMPWMWRVLKWATVIYPAYWVTRAAYAGRYWEDSTARLAQAKAIVAEASGQFAPSAATAAAGENLKQQAADAAAKAQAKAAEAMGAAKALWGKHNPFGNKGE